MKKLNVVLDIDEIIADFMSGILDEARRRGITEGIPSCLDDVYSWHVSDNFLKVLNSVRDDNEFWLNLNVLSIPHFIPRAYLTARFCESEITKQWFEKHDIPQAEIITVKDRTDKIAILKRLNPDLFVDDNVWTIQECIDAGINAMLFKHQHQRDHYEEAKDLPTISSLAEIDQILSNKD